MVRLFAEQIDRRRSFYLSLLHGTGAGDVAVVEVYDEIWDRATRRVLTCSTSPRARRRGARLVDVRRGHRAVLVGTAADRRTRTLEGLVDHGLAALHALVRPPRTVVMLAGDPCPPSEETGEP